MELSGPIANAWSPILDIKIRLRRLPLELSSLFDVVRCRYKPGEKALLPVDLPKTKVPDLRNSLIG